MDKSCSATTTTTTSTTTTSCTICEHDARDGRTATRAERLELALAAWQAARSGKSYATARPHRHYRYTCGRVTSSTSAYSSRRCDEHVAGRSTDVSSSSCGCASSCTCRTSGSRSHNGGSNCAIAYDAASGRRGRKENTRSNDPFLDETRLVNVPPLLQLPFPPYPPAGRPSSPASDTQHDMQRVSSLAAPSHDLRGHTLLLRTLSPGKAARHGHTEAETQSRPHHRAAHAVQTDDEHHPSRPATTSKATQAAAETRTTATQCEGTDRTTTAAAIIHRVERATSPLAARDAPSMAHKAVDTADHATTAQATANDGAPTAAEQPSLLVDAVAQDTEGSTAALLHAEEVQRAWLVALEHDTATALYGCHARLAQSAARWQREHIAVRQDAEAQRVLQLQREHDTIVCIDAQHAVMDAEQMARHTLNMAELQARCGALGDAFHAYDTAVRARETEAAQREAAARTAALEQKLTALQAAHATSTQHEKALMLQLMHVLRLPTVQLVERANASSAHALADVDLPVHRRFARAHQEALRATLAQCRHL